MCHLTQVSDLPEMGCELPSHRRGRRAGPESSYPGLLAGTEPLWHLNPCSPFSLCDHNKGMASTWGPQGRAWPGVWLPQSRGKGTARSGWAVRSGRRGGPTHCGERWSGVNGKEWQWPVPGDGQGRWHLPAFRASDNGSLPAGVVCFPDSTRVHDRRERGSEPL